MPCSPAGRCLRCNVFGRRDSQGLVAVLALTHPASDPRPLPTRFRHLQPSRLRRPPSVPALVPAPQGARHPAQRPDKPPTGGSAKKTRRRSAHGERSMYHICAPQSQIQLADVNKPMAGGAPSFSRGAIGAPLDQLAFAVLAAVARPRRERSPRPWRAGPHFAEPATAAPALLASASICRHPLRAADRRLASRCGGSRPVP